MERGGRGDEERKVGGRGGRVGRQEGGIRRRGRGGDPPWLCSAPAGEGREGGRDGGRREEEAEVPTLHGFLGSAKLLSGEKGAGRGGGGERERGEGERNREREGEGEVPTLQGLLGSAQFLPGLDELQVQLPVTRVAVRRPLPPGPRLQ